jgi:hypothetical protein
MSVRYWYFFLLFSPDFATSIMWLVGLVHEPEDAIHAILLPGILYNGTLYWLNNMSLPYVGFAIITIAVVLYKDKTAQQMQAASWRLPIYFTPLFMVVFYVTNQTPGLSLLSSPMWWTIVAGYFTVLLGHAVTWLLLKARLLSD